MDKQTIDDADITVTSATQSVEDVKARLAAPKEPAADPDAALDPTLEEEVESPKSDAEVSEAARKLRQEAGSQKSDAEVSKSAQVLRQRRSLKDKREKLTADITLYEENLRELGGAVPAFEKVEYKNAQHEIDSLTRRSKELLEATNKHLKDRKRAPVAAVPPVVAPPPAVVPAAAAAAPAPKAEFAFETWEQWQEKHPEDDYTAFLDARQDARYAWKVEQDKSAAAQQAAEKADADATAASLAAEQTFKAEHEDYDVKVAPFMEWAIKAVDAKHPAALALQKVIRREGANAPALSYYLATHEAEVNRLFASPTAAAFYETIGEIRYAAKVAAGASPATAPAAAAAAAAPAAARPAAKPPHDAPAPLAETPGSAHHARTAAQIAEDSEFADDYIAAREKDLGIRPAARA